MAGSTNLALFDKTGTLTVDGLTLEGLYEGDKFAEDKLVSDMMEASMSFQLGLVGCNALSTAGDELIGDPLEIEIFKRMGWSMDSSNDIVTLRTKSPSWNRSKHFHSRSN